MILEESRLRSRRLNLRSLVERQYPMLGLAMVLEVGICMVLEEMLMELLVVIINLAASTMVEEVGDMVEAMATVQLLPMVQDSALALLGPCMGQVDMVLVMVMVAPAAMETPTAVMEVVEDMEDTIHMDDKDYNHKYLTASRHICLRML